MLDLKTIILIIKYEYTYVCHIYVIILIKYDVKDKNKNCMSIQFSVPEMENRMRIYITYIKIFIDFSVFLSFVFCFNLM